MSRPEPSLPGDHSAPLASRPGSYVRTVVTREDELGLLAPPGAPSAGSLAAASEDPEAFLDQWLGRHFSVSVKLFDIQRSLGHATKEAPSGGFVPDAEAVLQDLELVQDVLFELREFAASDKRVQDRMYVTRSIQNGVVTVYAWLDETLTAIARTGAAFRRSPSFADTAGEGVPYAMLRVFERLHPDLEALVGTEQVGVDRDVAHKLAFSFRRIGAAIVRISGRGVTSMPPMP